MSLHRYEGLLILNTKGSDEGAKEIIERLEGDFKKEGARIEQVQKMGSRQFSYAAGHLSSGYFVNFVFESESSTLDQLRAKFKLDQEVYRQQYIRLETKAPAAAK